MKKMLRPLVVLIVALATTLSIADHSAAQTSRPNVVLIMTDDQNVDSLPVMRYLMSFPEGSWVNFTNAIVNLSICCPSRSSVLTGQYAHVTGVINNRTGDRLDDSNTLPVWLHNAGYRTGLIGKYLNGYPWDRGENYIPPGWDYFNATKPGSVDMRSHLAAEFIRSSTGPFFLYLAYQAPHHPATPLARYRDADVYVPPDPPNFDEKDVSDKPTWVQNLSRLSRSTIESWREERVASQRALLGIDDGIQEVMEVLKTRGQLENTLIIFMGDHGFSWGSHRWVKKECVYEECIRFPLLIRYPGLGGNREEPRIVSNVDLAATIAEFAGVTPQLPQNGKSFVSVIMDTATTWKEEVFLELHKGLTRGFQGIRVPGWTYAEYANGEKELYDLAADPYQLHNVGDNPAYQDKQDELARRIRVIKGP